MINNILKYMNSSKILISVILLVFISITQIKGQHRGDPLAFQGLSNSNDYSVKSMAMGNAYTSISGELGALYFNPAGLASINKMKVSASGSRYYKKWQENQVYRPNRIIVHLPFYLGGLYTPSELNYDSLGNPRWDNEISIDSNYVVDQPEMGNKPFSEEGADWIREVDDVTLNTFTVAYPLNVLNRNLVISLGYKHKYNLLDFDRNDTYLDPHIGYSKYNMPELVSEGDTVHMDWYKFMRKRSGNLHTGKLGIGFELNKNIKLGLGFSVTSGESDDRLILDKYGYFDILKNNEFRFGFDSLRTEITGKSEFSTYAITLGGIYDFEKLSVGLNVKLPQTVTRSYEYQEIVADTLGLHKQSKSGEDTFKTPMIFNLGVNLRPVEKFMVTLDLKNAKYSKAEFNFANAHTDSTHNSWADQTILRAGLEYQLMSFISIMAGYQTVPQTFVPDGHAFKDQGPESTIYSLGTSISIFEFGRLDIAYRIQELKYWDQYMSNTNYNLIRYDKLSFGYVYTF